MNFSYVVKSIGCGNLIVLLLKYIYIVLVYLKDSNAASYC